MSKVAKCVDCGKRLDFKAGVAMRGPLDARVVCLPCKGLLDVPQLELEVDQHKRSEPEGESR